MKLNTGVEISSNESLNDILSLVGPENDNILIIKGYTSNCSACKSLELNWSDLEDKLTELPQPNTVIIKFVDLSNHSDYISHFGIRTVPTTLIMTKELVMHVKGDNTQGILDIITKL